MTETFRQDLSTAHVSPLWDVMANLVTEEPSPQTLPFAWAYGPLRDLLMQAGELITAEQAERRVLILENPGLPEGHSATESLYAGLQLVLPDEIAPVHRHTQSALRFVLESRGAWTAVDGERVIMEPFDLVLTPSWRWHEHGGGQGPAIWLDGLDIPIVRQFCAAFAEREGNVPEPDNTTAGACIATYGSNLRPVKLQPDTAHSPLFHFPYAQWSEALERYSAVSAMDPHTGWLMEFVNPANAGPVMATISAFCQKIPAGITTKKYRQSAGAVYVGVAGNGSLIVNEQRFSIGPRDVVAVPSWYAVEIDGGHEGMTLFSYSDRACHEKLGFWREARA